MSFKINLSRITNKLKPFYEKFKEYTMVPKAQYIFNLILIDSYRNVPGAVVECGTWKGGMIAGMAMLLGDERKYFLFDSFEGLPPAKEIDGEKAIEWQKDVKSPLYYDNCTASEIDAKNAMILSGVKDFQITKGWFNETLPRYDSTNKIAILRLDADWYDSTIECLKYLFPHVCKGGIIIIDDYGYWDGCSKAIHDYLSKNERTEKIRKFYNTVYYILKK